MNYSNPIFDQAAERVLLVSHCLISLNFVVELPQHEWSNRGAGILGSTIPIYVLSIAVLSWRVIYRVRTRRKLFLGDYLLMVTAVGPHLTISSSIYSINMREKSTSFAGMIVRCETVEYGLGRHINDPSINLRRFSYFLWISRILNVLSIAVLKYSICAYPLTLNFSKIYVGIVWASVIMVTALNLILPCCLSFHASHSKRIGIKQLPAIVS